MRENTGSSLLMMLSPKLRMSHTPARLSPMMKADLALVALQTAIESGNMQAIKVLVQYPQLLFEYNSLKKTYLGGYNPEACDYSGTREREAIKASVV